MDKKKLLKRILYLQNALRVHSKMSESETLDAIAEIVSPFIFIVMNAQGSTTYNFERVDDFFITYISLKELSQRYSPSPNVPSSFFLKTALPKSCYFPLLLTLVLATPVSVLFRSYPL